MGILGDAIGKRRRPVAIGPGGAASSAGGQAGGPPPGPVLASPAPAATAPAPLGDGRSELRRRRDTLAEEVTEMHWDLGGLAYEMAIRDHFRLDVLVRRAARLQDRDAELAEVERLLALEETASAGACPQCGAPHSRGALFCWQCGAMLMERSPSTAAADGIAVDRATSSSAVMDALLAPPGQPADDAAEDSDE